MAYMAISIDALWSVWPPVISGSWPAVWRSASWCRWSQSSSGRPISRPITWVGRRPATSWTSSTSPASAAMAMSSRQVVRICSSISAITEARKLDASGRR